MERLRCDEPGCNWIGSDYTDILARFPGKEQKIQTQASNGLKLHKTKKHGGKTVKSRRQEKIEEAAQAIEGALQSKRESLAYAAPEMHDAHWQDLRDRLVGILERSHQ